MTPAQVAAGTAALLHFKDTVHSPTRDPEGAVRAIGAAILAATATMTNDASVMVPELLESVLREAFKMVDALNPPPAGSYRMGEHNGIIAALKTVRDLYPRAVAGTYPFAAAPAQAGGEP